jgi:thioredoxin reductase (NADPH)
LYQGIQPGGQLTITTEVENYPGYADGVQGPEMMVDFEKQATRMGSDIRFGLATKVDFQHLPLKFG